MDGHYVLKGNNLVTFEVASYDRSKLLIIDPVLVYSTYLGGSGPDAGIGIAVDASGKAYVTGETSSLDFPTMNASQPASAGGGDAFVSKLNAAGSALVYSTYLGGSGSDAGTGIAVDGLGNAYVTGQTRSTTFPTTSGAFQTSFGGGFSNAFVSKLNAGGSALAYSTYLGGSRFDLGSGIAVDASGNAYVTGQAGSTNFPITSGAFQTSLRGSGDAFVSKLSAAGSALVYSTFLGGSGFDLGLGVAVDASGNAYVTGETLSSDFPTTSGALQTSFGGGYSDAFVSKLNAAGSALVYSSYLGGRGGDQGSGIVVDASGDAYVTGLTDSADFPTVDPLQPRYGGGGNVFVTKLNAAGSALVYSTYLGGRGGDLGSGIAVDASGNTYLTGSTGSPDFPTVNPFQPAKAGAVFAFDAFVAKISPANAPGVALSRTVLAFGNQPVGTTGSPQTITVTNVGSQPLLFRRIVSVSLFPQTNTCGASLAPGQRCIITVTFAPTLRGPKRGLLFLVDNVQPRPIQFVWMTGTGS